MKRILLGIAMAGGLALAAAPMANAALPECGYSYAFQVHGTEPNNNGDPTETINAGGSGADVAAAGPLNYIAGVGVISIGTTAFNGCQPTGGEMIYDDDGFATGLLGAPSGLPGAYPGTGYYAAFDGTSHFTGMSLTPGPDGGATLTFTANFGFTDGSPIASSSIELSFWIQANTGASIVTGTSVATNGPNDPPPTSPYGGTSAPVLTLVMQKQGTLTYAPANYVAGKTYGTLPFLGLSTISCEGYGNKSSDPFALPAYGSFGSTSGAIQIFSNGAAAGSLNFNSNDNVGTENFPLGGINNNLDCAFYSTQPAASPVAFPDGTYNALATLPVGSPSCANGYVDAQDATGAAVWGATDLDSYQMVTAIADAIPFPLGTAGYLSEDPGEVAYCTTYGSVPAGLVTNLVVPSTFLPPKTSSPIPYVTTTGYVKMTNTSPATCAVTATLGGTQTDGICSLTLTSASSPELVTGNTPSTQYFTTGCSCTGIDATGFTGGTVTLSSSNCLLYQAAGETSSAGPPSTVTHPLACHTIP